MLSVAIYRDDVIQAVCTALLRNLGSTWLLKSEDIRIKNLSLRLAAVLSRDGTVCEPEEGNKKPEFPLLK